MALMTVGDETSRNFRSKPRWSTGKKMDVVLRLLRGEKLEELSRELGVEAHRIAAWRDEFLEGGKEGLKGKPGHDRGRSALARRRAQDRRAHARERDLEEGGRK